MPTTRPPQSRWTKVWDRSWDELGCLGMLAFVVLLVATGYVKTRIPDSVFVCLCYGTDAYFNQGIRVADWKHGVLNNGEKIGMPLDIFRVVPGFVVLCAVMTFHVWWLAALKRRLERRR